MKNIKNKFIPLLISIFAAVTLGLSGCMDLFDKEDVPTSFTITFNGNGGKTASGATTYTQNYAYGETKALMANEFINSGYKIKGWDVNKDSTTAKYGEGSEQEFSADTILYAIWEKNGCSVEYDGGEAGSIDLPVDEKIYESGDTVTIDSMVPVWSGYTFKGWKKSDDTSETLYQPSGTFIINASVKLTAKWEGNDISGGLNLTPVQETDDNIFLVAVVQSGVINITCSESDNYIWIIDGDDRTSDVIDVTTNPPAEAGRKNFSYTIPSGFDKGNIDVTLIVYKTSTGKTYSVTYYVTL